MKILNLNSPGVDVGMKLATTRLPATTESRRTHLTRPVAPTAQSLMSRGWRVGLTLVYWVASLVAALLVRDLGKLWTVVGSTCGAEPRGCARAHASGSARRRN